MAYPFGVRQERRPTFLHPDGLLDDPSPFVTRFGLELPGIITSRFELDALQEFINNQQRNLLAPEVFPTLKHLGRIAINDHSGCWELKESSMGLDKLAIPEVSPDQLSIYEEASIEEVPKIKPKRPCWSGYGSMKVSGIDVGSRAHRVIHTAIYGPIPEETPVLDHLCENKKCCWHRHPQPVTLAENTNRIKEAYQRIPGELRIDTGQF
jgi:hypothetical protein